MLSLLFIESDPPLFPLIQTYGSEGNCDHIVNGGYCGAEVVVLKLANRMPKKCSTQI